MAQAENLRDLRDRYEPVQEENFLGVETVRTDQNVPPRSTLPVQEAQAALQVAFVVIPIIAGLDKYLYFLADWTQYLAPVFPRIFSVTPVTFMYFVGAIEVIVGIGMAIKPRVFAYILGAWLLGIIVNLFVNGGPYDVALRDLGLAVAAFALARLSYARERDFRF